MQKLPIDAEFKKFVSKVYPGIAQMSEYQKNILREYFYAGGLMVYKAGVEGDDSPAKVEHCERVLREISTLLQKYTRQLKRSSRPPMLGKFKTTFLALVAMGTLSEPAGPSSKVDLYNAYVAGAMTVMNLLVLGTSVTSDDIAMTEVDIVMRDFKLMFTLDTNMIPSWPVEE